VEETGILSNLSSAQQKELDQSMKEMILATDNSKHFLLMKSFENI
jgi:hypothetical protein